jgi:ABC-2 type transport system ATP-binding protein
MQMTTTTIETENLTKLYQQDRGIRNVALRVQAGSVYGFLGANGAGKTTTIRALLCLLRPDSGTIRIFNEEMPSQARRIFDRIGVVPGEIHLYEELTGLQLLDYFQGFIRRKPVMRRELMEAFSLSENDLGMKVRQFSQGMKQKLLLIQAMQHDPDLLILDEPSERLDPLHQQVLYEYILTFKKRGKTVFFSSHNLPEVEKICDQVGIIKDGRLKVQQPVEALKKQIPRTIEIWFEEPFDKNDFIREGIRILEARSDYLRLELTGDMRSLIQICHQQKVREIIIPAPSMEKLFMSYYQRDPKEHS